MLRRSFSFIRQGNAIHVWPSPTERAGATRVTVAPTVTFAQLQKQACEEGNCKKPHAGNGSSGEIKGR